MTASIELAFLMIGSLRKTLSWVYKQLHVIEKVYWDLKHVIDTRPINHRLEDRIRAHVLLCWMAMLMIRIAENESGLTWFQMKNMFSSNSLGVFRAPQGEIHQSRPISADLKKLYKILRVQTLPRYFKLPIPKMK